jgi:glycosyltransferase involved in cell wall biosynthesis
MLSGLPGGAALARAIVARADHVACVSDDLARRLTRLAPEAASRLSVVRMGAEIGPPPEPGAAERLRDELGARGRTVALFLGRLIAVKGVDVLVDAAALAPGVDVWIAGDGPDLERLRERARAAKLRVSFLGRIDRRRRRLALEACDAVVVPSRIEPNGRAEGSPVVCAEGLAAGRPVVATKTGGIVEVIEDGRTGLLVPPDDPDALARALERLAADAALGARLRAGAEAASREVSAEATASSFAAIFRGLARA